MSSAEDDYAPSEVVSHISGVLEALPAEEDPYIEQDDSFRSSESSSEGDNNTATASSGEEASSPNSFGRSRKRRRLPDYSGAPLKRQKCTFNADYLALLNQDIQDAAAGLVVSTETNAAELQDSQLGATRWNHIEKEALFSALGRLGRDDLPGIAARIGTKGAVEVHQYLVFLSETELRRRQAEGDLRRKTLKPVEVLAAVEVSQDCCNALDEVGDDLSLRQEGHEVAVEEKKWGDKWLVTKSLSKELDEVSMKRKGPDVELPFAELFILRNWIRVSEHMFMNSSIPEYNWRWFSDSVPPAIRSTALSDFHALAVSVTRRLVAAALHMSQSRIKAKKEVVAKTRHVVKARDVKAAADSISMKTSRREFWARSARRLRLDVYGSKGEDEGEGGGDEIMSYDDIEAALGYRRPHWRTAPERDDDDDDDDNDDLSDTSTTSTPIDSMNPEIQDTSESNRDLSPETAAIKYDLEEAMHFSADFEGTTRARQALQSRIQAEYRLEAEADEHDARASTQEEARLWGVLRQQGVAPQWGTTTMPSTGGPGQTTATTTGLPKGARRAVFEPAVGYDWRATFEYMSEWEVAGRDAEGAVGT
ncbi:uncharacterized protein BCR38DRAFT_435879 [Pseudomassariella vexata]|uniref:Myb-like domain-containing protein n=1 Tax=Pseudomassariella vexata TaxID=1141098 RepID=A0A1Y2DV02_9PEZI|nr:uncharacterized protein BCR38DRAFT_435879 [Pseudomassariella vexata]ORY63101.1 hypothetical protein BCR38DRAFT_435879 [Pseudomassariella vexata]